MLTDAQVLAYKTRSGCCALSAYSESNTEASFGQTGCANKAYRRGLWLTWAQGIFCGTVTAANEDGCYSKACASKVAKVVDCHCECPCPPAEPDPCAVIVNYSVVAAVAVSDRATVEAIPPQLNDRWFVSSGTTDGVWTLNEVVTWNGSGWDTLNLPSGQIVETDADVYWTTDGQTPGLLYPTVTATFQSPGVYDVVSDYPSIAAISDRTVIIQTFGIIDTGQFQQVGWTTVLTVAEQVIAEPYPFNFTGITLDAIRAIYVDGQCQNTSENGNIEPPGCVFPGDHDCDDHQITSHF